MQILPPEACSFHKEKWHILNNIVENWECEIDFETNFRNKRSFLKKKQKNFTFLVAEICGGFFAFFDSFRESSTAPSSLHKNQKTWVRFSN